MRSYQEAMRRAACYARGVDPDTGKTHKTHKTDNNHQASEFKTDKTHKNYKGLYLLIHSDEDFLLAQSWGMEPGLLYNLCKTYGVQQVQGFICKVKKIGPRYFREGEPIEPQRGRYCRAIILKEAQPIRRTR